MSQWKLHTPSPEKLAANQANALRSTGPKTPEGKRTASMNAVKHGLTARELIIRVEDQPAFDELHSAYLAELQPAGILETEMLNSIVHAAWNLRRIRILEAALFDGSIDPLEDEQNEPKLARLTRYYKRFESTLLKCTRELRTLQSNRAARAGSPEPIEAAPLADPCTVARAKRTHFQSFADEVRAELGATDLMMARATGKVVGPLFTEVFREPPGRPAERASYDTLKGVSHLWIHAGNFSAEWPRGWRPPSPHRRRTSSAPTTASASASSARARAGTRSSARRWRCPNVEFVASADVYTRRLEEAKKLAPEAKTYLDYRYLLEDKSIDAVLIATPQHLHCEHFVAVARRRQARLPGKDDGVHRGPRQAHAGRVPEGAGKRVVQIGHQSSSSGPGARRRRRSSSRN